MDSPVLRSSVPPQGSFVRLVGLVSGRSSSVLWAVNGTEPCAAGTRRPLVSGARRRWGGGSQQEKLMGSSGNGVGNWNVCHRGIRIVGALLAAPVFGWGSWLGTASPPLLR